MRIETKIKELRKRDNLSQEQLANLVGVRRETIGNLEIGRYNPSLALAWSISKIFNLSIEEVFTVYPED